MAGESNRSDRTTLSLSNETKGRLDDAAPPGASWDERIGRLLDGTGSSDEWNAGVRVDAADAEDSLPAPREEIEAALDAAGSFGEVLDAVATEEDLDGLRDDLLSNLPSRVADELADRRP